MFVKYEAGFVGGGGGGPPPYSLLTRAWERVFMADFLFFFSKLHCSGPIEFTLPYRGTGG